MNKNMNRLVTVVLCMVALLATHAAADDSNLLLVYAPASAIPNFPDGCIQNFNCDGDVPNRPALFGITPIENGIDGVVVAALSFGDSFACTTFNILQNETQLDYFNQASGFGQRKLILLIDRGGCTFSSKVFNSQIAGFSSVIMVNSDDGALPYMIDDGSGRNVYIPSLIISKSDGDIFKSQINSLYYQSSPAFLQVQMLLWIPRPDNRVEVDFFAPSYDSESRKSGNSILIGSATQFRTSFGSSALALGSNALFIPHVTVFTTASCSSSPSQNCPGLCTNYGRYCYFGTLSANDSAAGVGGTQVVQEAIRQFTLWTLLNNSGVAYNIFKYYSVYYGPGGCGNFTATKPRDYSSACSFAIIDSLNRANAWSAGANDPVSISSNDILLKHGNIGELYDANIPYIDSDMATYKELSPITLPFIFVNRAPLYGGVNCPTPITRTTCSITAAICNGFESASISACQTSEDCPLGMTKDRCSVCNGNNACLTGSGTSLGVLFAVAVVLSILAVIGIIWYTRRQQAGTRSDIDKLLSQYLPSDTALGTPASKKTLAGMHKARLMSDEDQNVMLDSAEDI